MPRFSCSAGLALTAAATTILLAPAALAASATPSPSAPRTPVLRVTAAPSPVPSVRSTAAGGVRRGGEDIDVPAGRASVPASGHGDELALVALTGAGALLLAGGTVVVVARRRP